MFKVKTEGNEHPLEHQQLFMEYQHMFEDVMSAFITNEGFTIQQFYQEVQQELEALPKGSDQNTTFASVLFSALDFTTFCEMMNDVKVKRHDTIFVSIDIHLFSFNCFLI